MTKKTAYSVGSGADTHTVTSPVQYIKRAKFDALGHEVEAADNRDPTSDPNTGVTRVISGTKYDCRSPGMQIAESEPDGICFHGQLPHGKQKGVRQGDRVNSTDPTGHSQTSVPAWVLGIAAGVIAGILTCVLANIGFAALGASAVKVSIAASTIDGAAANVAAGRSAQLYRELNTTGHRLCET